MSDEPPKKRQKMSHNFTSFNEEITTAIKSPSLCDVTFRIQKQSSTIERANNDSLESKSSSSDIDTNVNFTDYDVNSFPFIMHSKVFSTMLMDNNKKRNNLTNDNTSGNKNDGNIVLPLNDLEPAVFEFSRDYCYGLQPKLNKDFIFKILLASIKYMIDSLSLDCIKFIRNDWIVNRESLFEFLLELSNFEDKTGINIISKDCMLKIFNENKVLQRYACEFISIYDFGGSDEFLSLSPDVVIGLLQCDSLYLGEHIIWRIVNDYVETCGRYFHQCSKCEETMAIEELQTRLIDGCASVLCPDCVEFFHVNHDDLEKYNFLSLKLKYNYDFEMDGVGPEEHDKVKKYGLILSKFTPYIRFDIIGFEYFMNQVKPILLQHDLMNESQLFNILLSWTDSNLASYKEKFTLKRQRCLFNGNYLTSIDDIQPGDTIDICTKENWKNGFTSRIVQRVDKESKEISLGGDDPVTKKWTDIIAAKGGSIFWSISMTLRSNPALKRGQVVQFRSIFKQNDPSAWQSGFFDGFHHCDVGEVEICPMGVPRQFNSESCVYVCASDENVFRLVLPHLRRARA